MSSEDVGIYNAAYKIFNAIANFTFVISSYYAGNISQYFAKKEYVKIRNFFYRERFIIFGLSLFLHLIIILFSKPIILFLYGVRYVESISILNVLLIGSVFRYITVFYMLYYNTNNKYRLQQVINIFRAIINIILDIIFIKIFGLIGPAIATTVAMFLAFVFSLFYCEKRIYGLSKSDNNSKCE
ncbi:MAG: polysaccharide biosynthesis C-terminal domain-containing protein [Clostridiales bacterium]|nr:polysaccharide biosynthesis C-terminal domain-containing protein [Clostridiales bacterium]